MKHEKKIIEIIAILAIASIIGAIIGIGAFYYFRIKNLNPSVETQQPSITKQTLEIPAPPQTPESIFDCETNLDCLSEKSLLCETAEAMTNSTTSIFGVTQKTDKYLKISKLPSGNCNLYIRLENIETTFPPNTSKEDIYQQQQITSNLRGRDGNCEFNSDELSAILKRWQQKVFDYGETSCELTPTGNKCITKGGDFSIATCSGTYFNSGL